jgi:hypothetical protein
MGTTNIATAWSLSLGINVKQKYHRLLFAKTTVAVVVWLVNVALVETSLNVGSKHNANGWWYA